MNEVSRGNEETEKVAIVLLSNLCASGLACGYKGGFVTVKNSDGVGNKHLQGCCL